MQGYVGFRGLPCSGVHTCEGPPGCAARRVCTDLSAGPCGLLYTLAMLVLAVQWPRP